MTIKISRRIWVTFQKAGLHRYPQASTDKNLSDVSYLGFTHRHLFKFKVAIEITHNDRDIEFHQFLNWLESLYDKQAVLSLNSKSCEMIAEDLAVELSKKYPGRTFSIDVSEDGECGAVLEFKGAS